jgi:hypothetical protein
MLFDGACQDTLSSDSEDFYTDYQNLEDMDYIENIKFSTEEKNAVDLAKGTTKHVYNKSDYYTNDMEYYS